MNNPSKKQLILIIDDNKDSLNFLVDIFVDYKKAITTSGTEGIKLAKQLMPDLILLDIIMPEISGYDVCMKIKEDPNCKEIPIIFISGKNNLEDVVKGFDLGAVDYITKPYQSEELIMRVKKNLELKESRDLIVVQNEKLKDLNEELNNFLNVATHDLKNSLVVIQGFLKILSNQNYKFTDQEKQDIINDVTLTSDNMYKILSNLLLISKLEGGLVSPQENNFDFNYLVNESMNYFENLAKLKNINIAVENEANPILINNDYKLIKECVDNLLSNAIKFSPKNSNIFIKINLNKQSKKISFEIEDEGPGIKQSEITMLFKKFSRISSHATNRETTTGLGLALTKMIVDLLKGTIKYESSKKKGSKFILTLPI